jgi:hypothetical protein
VRASFTVVRSAQLLCNMCTVVDAVVQNEETYTIITILPIEFSVATLQFSLLLHAESFVSDDDRCS